MNRGDLFPMYPGALFQGTDYSGDIATVASDLDTAEAAIVTVASDLDTAEAAIVATDDFLTADDWHEVGGVGEPAFQGSWSNFGGTNRTAGFKKVGNTVHIKGLITGGPTSGVVFNVPAAYRPSIRYPGIAFCSTGAYRIDVEGGGDVRVYNASVAYTSIEIVFELS